MANLKEQVGHAVRHQRKLRKWTQGDLAGRTGRSVEMVARVERGVIAPSLETLEAFAEAFNISVRDLFGVGEHAAGAGEPDGLVRLIGRLSSLGAEDIDWIERVVIAALSRDEGRPRPGARPDSAPS
jgi:transcriptional regulator with XRE-family HTH domain